MKTLKNIALNLKWLKSTSWTESPLYPGRALSNEQEKNAKKIVLLIAAVIVVIGVSITAVTPKPTPRPTPYVQPEDRTAYVHDWSNSQATPTVVAHKDTPEEHRAKGYAWDQPNMDPVPIPMRVDPNQINHYDAPALGSSNPSAQAAHIPLTGYQIDQLAQQYLKEATGTKNDRRDAQKWMDEHVRADGTLQ